MIINMRFQYSDNNTDGCAYTSLFSSVFRRFCEHDVLLKTSLNINVTRAIPPVLSEYSLKIL